MPIGLRFEYNQAQFKSLSKKLDSFERKDVLGQTLGEVGEFMRGKLKEYPSYRYVSRKAAYGVSFFSDKQHCPRVECGINSGWRKIILCLSLQKRWWGIVKIKILYFGLNDFIKLDSKR